MKNIKLIILPFFIIPKIIMKHKTRSYLYQYSFTYLPQEYFTSFPILSNRLCVVKYPRKRIILIYIKEVFCTFCYCVHTILFAIRNIKRTY